MQAQSNDFVILDGLSATLPKLSQALAKKICDRHAGIGCDQLLVLREDDSADAWMLIYNADGSQAKNCGNGLRCAGSLLMQRFGKDIVSIALEDRTVEASKTEQGIRVNMGKAVVESVTEAYVDVDMGNPHRVCFQESVACPERNVEIVESYDEQQARIRIIERGTGETLACGSGACATAAAIWQQLESSSPLTIHMPGGDVLVSTVGKNIFLEGSVATVFEGTFHFS